MSPVSQGAEHAAEQAGLGAMLTTLARADEDGLKALAETLLDDLPDLEVLENRTGLVMVPMQDTAGGATFHLGEALVSEAHVTSGTAEGYGMRRGRDLEATLAMAIVDLAMALDLRADECRAFVDAETARQAAEDRETLCRVEATRVDMETF